MSFAFKTAAGVWIEIEQAGSLLPGGGEQGEDVRLSDAFVMSLPEDTRAERGFIEVVETEAPEGWIGWTIEDVEGAPTRAWQTLPEA